MANRIAKWILATAGTSLPAAGSEAVRDVPRQEATGILTSRLSSRQTKTWKSVEQVVWRQNREGRPLYPTLQALWQAVESSGCAIYIEINARGKDNAYLAGKFAIEEMDSRGKIVSVVIRLYPGVIDHASFRSNAGRADGFNAVHRLGRMERYAAVLGHELQHALLALTSAEYARLVWDQKQARADLFQAWRRDLTWKKSGKEIEEIRNRLHDLSIRLEDIAEHTETKIWEELAQARR